MNAKALIRKTRDGEALATEEIDFLVRGAVTGQVPSYQLTAWMMAVFWRSLTRRETVDLTRAMRESGDCLAFPDAPYPSADKHSTGGVGDKLSFLVAPLVAAAGVPVPMISGRSLGHTGGTLDKLETIPGFRTQLTPAELVRQVGSIGLCIAGQSERLAPADRILYSLRDAASIVESIPLITASILSKKAAAGVRALVLDVKCGDGAFMRDPALARLLAQSLVETASLLGIKARAHLTSMEFVLGHTAGNALEIAESARFLRRQEVSEVLTSLTLLLGSSMLELAGRVSSPEEGRELLDRLWRSGAGYDKFREMVRAQGGRVECLDDCSLLPRSDRVIEVPAPTAGRFLGIQARPVGDWITEAGGGRLRTQEPIDGRVGIEILCVPGARINMGDPVLRLHLGNAPPGPSLQERAASWIRVESSAKPPDSTGWEGSDEYSLVLGEAIESDAPDERSC